MFDFYLALLAGHLLACLIFFGLNIGKKGLQDSLVKFFISFLLPGIGLLFFAVMGIISRFSGHSEREIYSFLQYKKGEQHIYQENNIDFEKELNTVPLQDSLHFSDRESRRAYLIYILKKDLTGHVSGLRKAIESDDSETAHYAAAAMMEIRKEFEEMLLNKSESFEKAVNDIREAEEYAAIIKRYLESGIGDETDAYDYRLKYSEVLEYMLEKGKTDPGLLSEKISVDLELEDYEMALKYCRIFLEDFPENETAYLSSLKLFYSIRDIDAFKKLTGIMEEKRITVSDEIEKQLDFWKERSLA